MKLGSEAKWYHNVASSVKGWTARGKLLILAITSISILSGCSSTNFYASNSSHYPAFDNYLTGNLINPANAVYGLVHNIAAYNYYGMNADDKQKQQEAVFYALNNADNGEVVEWYNEKANTYGKVKPVQSYPQGSGYCRTLFSLISVKNKTRTFTETACVEGGHEGWRFIRK